MEPNICLFHHAKEPCGGKKPSHIQYLICDKHLKEIYGLHITWSPIETPTEMIYVGFNLSVYLNSFFRENDVIIPVRLFYDKIFRPTHVTPTEFDKKFRINQTLYKYIHGKMRNGVLDSNDRYTYEMIRNLSEKNEAVNVNPTKNCEHDPQAISFLTSKMTVSDTYIKNYILPSTYKNISVYGIDDQPNGTDLDNIETLSLGFRYLLSKGEYCVHIASDDTDKVSETQRLRPNAIFVEGVGLVATRNISFPDTIVIAGIMRGFAQQAYDTDNLYSEMCIVEPKEIVQPTKLLPQQNKMPHQQSTRKGFQNSCLSGRMM